MSRFDLFETQDIITVFAEPYLINGCDKGEMSTVHLERNGERLDSTPTIGPWHRSERLLKATIDRQ